MANPRFAWGIDIGNRALKAVKLVRDNETLRLDDIEVIEHEQVLSNSGDNKESLIQTALANFAQRHPTKGGIVAVGVSGQASFARFIKLPPVEEGKIPEIVKFEAIQQIPFPLDDVEWSYQLFRQQDNPDVEVGIFAMRKELVNQQLKYFSDMNMNVQVVQMSPLAVYNAMYYDSRVQDGTTMILDLGAENADLIIADGESVWLRSISIGGNNFTEALVKAFKLNFTKAEELKRNAQTSKYARQIFQAMRPIFADLVAEIQRSIGFYASVHRDSRIKKIIALGNTFRLPTLQKYLQQNLQMDVERLDGFSAGAPEDGRIAALLNENLASMAGAYGLALQAMGQGKITSSLLPRTIQVEKIWKEKTKWFMGAAAVLVLAAGVKFGAYYMNNQQFESKADDRRVVNGTINIGKALDSEWNKLQDAGGPSKQTIKNVIALAQYRDTWADLWTDLTGTLPPDTGKSPTQIKSTPRGDRQQIFIDAVYSRYEPDMGRYFADKMNVQDFKEMAKTLGSGNTTGPTLTPTPGVEPGTGGVPIAPSRFGRGGYRPVAPQPDSPGDNPDGGTSNGPTRRGFLISIHCTSPYKDASTLVESTLVKKVLEQLSQEAGFKGKKSYYVERATLTSAVQIGQDETRRAALKAAWDAKQAAKAKMDQVLQGLGGMIGGGQDGGGPGAGGIRPNPGAFIRQPMLNPIQPQPGQNNPAADAEPFKDLLFAGEDVLKDWQVSVLLAVVLDPEKPQPKSNTPADGDNANPQTTAPQDPADDSSRNAVTTR